MSRVIRYYDKVDESYVGEVVMSSVSLVLLQELFNVSENNPMYDSYLIREAQRVFLEKYCVLSFDFHRYDYFLEYDADH